MQLIWLFLSFSGRIPRKSFWLATLILLASSMSVSTSLAAALNIGWGEYWLGSERTALLDLLIVVVFAWPNLAVNFKRLHDRGHSGWRAAVVQMLIVMLIMLEYSGLDKGDTLTVILFNIHLFITLVLFLWIMIEMGFLRGDPNTNQFGAPLDFRDVEPLKVAPARWPWSTDKRRRNGHQPRTIANSPIGPHHVSDS